MINPAWSEAQRGAKNTFRGKARDGRAKTHYSCKSSKGTCLWLTPG